jgi:membrane protein DedA with SNARE-associated domain
MGDPGAERATPPGAPSRVALAMVVVPIIGLVIANNVGNALAPALLPVPNDPSRSSNPLLLIALTPPIRNQVAVVNYVDPWLFLLVAGLRLMVADPFFFLLGRWYGDSAIHWMERRSPTAGQVLREVERWFAKASVVVVMIAANNIVCLLAGASRMRNRTFWIANVAGTLMRLLLIMWFGELLSTQIDAVLGFIGNYRPWILGATVLVVVFAGLRQLRRGTGELGQIRHLGEGLADGEHESEPNDADRIGNPSGGDSGAGAQPGDKADDRSGERTGDHTGDNDSPR